MFHKKKRRSFQHTENKYQSLFEQIIKTEYQGDFIDTASNGKTQDRATWLANYNSLRNSYVMYNSATSI